MIDFVLVLGISVGVVGLSMLFVGYLVGVATALGNKNYFFGISSIVFVPVALIYCLCFWEKAAYPGKLMLGGLALLSASVLGITFVI